MKLHKQSKLFFKEGNSDKVYEIDLCEISADQFVVNFRFGKRNSILKEGTKTEKPISLAAASQVFDTLEAEKRRKGYQSEQEMFQPLPKPTTNTSGLKHENALIQRLSDALEGTNSFKTTWKISRVIWKAGELKLKEATPYIIRLTDRGDEMQRYAALWALGRIADSSAERPLRVYFSNQKYTEKTRRIAGVGLLNILQASERQELIRFYTERLPENFRNDLENPIKIGQLLQTKITDSTVHEFDFIEDLYILSCEYTAIKKEIVKYLQVIPLKAGFFKPLRHILKIAEFRDDYEVLGLLSYRFERTLEMYQKPTTHYNDGGREYSSYIRAINQSLQISAEIKKKNSRIAYSDRTRAYLIRRTLRQLHELGNAKNTDYIKLALAILLAYDSKTDYKAAYHQIKFHYINNYQDWETVKIHHPEMADAVFMNLILYGNAKRLRFNGKVWQNTETELLNSSNNHSQTSQPTPVSSPNTQEGGILNRVFDSIFSLFSKPEKNDTSAQPNEVPTTHETSTSENRTLKIETSREELFPELWDKFPQAYIQLLLKSKVENIQVFALKNFSAHPDYEKIRQKIDFPLIEQLLASEYRIPAAFGLELVREKLQTEKDKNIILALVKSPLEEARKLGLEHVSKDINAYFGETAFVANLVFSPYENVRSWAKTTLIPFSMTETQQQLLLGRGIAQLSFFDENTELNNHIIKDATGILLKVCADEIGNLSNKVVIDLLASEVEATQVFAVRVIILKNVQPSAEALCSLVASKFSQVRKAGIELLNELKPKIETDEEFATSLVNFLVPLLMRKEPYEGLHQDIADILSNQLSKQLHSVNQTSTIRLIHSNYRPAQDFGLVLLNEYIDPNQLSIRQIIDLGNHELLVYRQWVWKYYEQNISRIKYEREESIRILDAKWDDTRAFAMDFFRTNFDENDWSAEALIGVVDSVRPDIETFGRELISRFFEEGQGEEYLLKLCQHPSTGVQLFTTNYLERFAANNPEKIRSLDFYFRSVLTRVNKGRSSKKRIFSFLHQEALKSAESAEIVADILRDISATVSIEDKAVCVQIMRNLQEKHKNLVLPIKILSFETR